ncbi:MAG: hypothetical protein U0792_23010 [Gemmataceae bacterium]
MKARTKAELDGYKGKLKDATILLSRTQGGEAGHRLDVSRTARPRRVTASEEVGSSKLEIRNKTNRWPALRPFESRVSSFEFTLEERQPGFEAVTSS